jgi:hypothetical protein
MVTTTCVFGFGIMASEYRGVDEVTPNLACALYTNRLVEVINSLTHIAM